MATTMVVGQQSHSMMSQHFRSELHQSQSQHLELKTPEGDLGDVEADFQKMVNEMAQDGSRRMVTQMSSSSSSMSSARSMQKSSGRPTLKPLNIPSVAAPSDPGIVRAFPAIVIPEVSANSVEGIFVESRVRVRDRINRLEKQLSEEDVTPVPDVIVPRGRSGSIKSLTGQFERTSDDVITSKKVEGEFKCVRETAAKFKEPISPIHIKPAVSDNEVEPEYPVGVLPPAISKQPSSPPTQPIPLPAFTSEEKCVSSSSVAQREFQSALNDISKYSDELSQTVKESGSTTSQSIVQPMYSAKVSCEVKTRVSTPDISTRNTLSETTSSMKQSRSEMWSSSASKRLETRSVSSSSASRNAIASPKAGGPSVFTASAPTPLARTAAKPPRAENTDYNQPKFSLLRSASAGSVGGADEERRDMHRTNSERELLQFNVKKVKTGSRVWTPGSDVPERGGPVKLESPDLPSFKDVPSVWLPGRAGSASPNLDRKEYKKISFDGPVRQRASQENLCGPRPEESFAWKSKEKEDFRKFSSGLPRIQSPTVTLLQKKREGQITDHRADYILPDEYSFYKPGDKLYTIKKEYESEDEELGHRKFAVLGPRKIEGVGPTTKDGMPISLRSGVKSEHQGEWYRRMFDSLHKVKDDSLSSKYNKCKVRYGGYMSEPDGYDSETGITRYGTYDRSRNEFDFEVCDTPSIKKTKRYVHQPGRIEDYIPGFSSLSERELKENPEADVKLEITGPACGRPSHQRFQGGHRHMSHALKESGYESDSTLIFKKRENSRRQILDPRVTSDLYKQIQRGGEIPLEGLQKPAPRPKEPVIGLESYPYFTMGYEGPTFPASHHKYDTSEVNIHYRTPIRVERKEHISNEELARRQEEHMKKVYEQERRKKYLSELEDIERRRHTDNFTPLQKSPIPLNRYDDEPFGGLRGLGTPEPPRQVAKALFSFHAQNKREMNFNKGDTITIRRTIDKNWFEGELRGNVGIFPCNYVEVVPFDSFKNLGKKSTEGQARVRFNFQAQTSMEMSLTKGEMIILTRRVDDNWYEGRVGGRKGILPISYVDVMVEPGDRATSPNREPMGRPSLPPAHLLYNGVSSKNSPYSTLGRPGSQTDTTVPYSQLTVNTQQEPIAYRALYNYKPQNDDELELRETDVVMVMEKCDDGWFVGTSQRTGLFGTFPGNYVEKA